MSEELQHYKSIGAIRNGERFQCQEILAFTVTRPCSVPGCLSKDMTAHHLVRGRRKISSDVLVIPLCQLHHNQLDHALSDELFEDLYGINLWWICIGNIELFLVLIAQASPTKIEHKRIGRGTAASRGNPGKGIAPLTKSCNTRAEYSFAEEREDARAIDQGEA